MTSLPLWLTAAPHVSLSQQGERDWALIPDADGPWELALPHGRAVLVDAGDELSVLPSAAAATHLRGRGWCWALPSQPGSDLPALLIQTDGELDLVIDAVGMTVRISGGPATVRTHRARPHADVAGAELTLDIADGAALADAYAGFYWDTMIPCVVERTRAVDYPDARGYVLSTLASTYAGTYPDVDHEFQIKGRIAAGSDVDLAVVRRTMELQIRMMREDPQGLWRNPCAVQPSGDREYHVRRSSMDGSQNAIMFLVTGNVEILESVWLYIARTKDVDWLRANIDALEAAAASVADTMDHAGRLWGDVYYEDQVIKDGRETMGAALASRSFRLLAELEDLLDRAAQAAHHRDLSDQLDASLREPLPQGYWDAEQRRFTDWVDRSDVSHDHIHLLANILPVLIGAATPEQSSDVLDLVERETPEFQRFPTFLSARIADYTDSEIGDGGPYDLCAAGRYWCWDAAFWASRGQGNVLAQQLLTVANEGALSDYIMGERYDMNHVYYADGTTWHGAAHYYEYPCVFTWVLLHEYLGVGESLTADLRLSPRLAAPGSIRLDQAAYQLSYSFTPEAFEVGNNAGCERRFELDLSALYPLASGFVVARADGAESVLEAAAVLLAPGETVTIRPVGEPS